MDLSIIIVTYNSSSHIDACLRSMMERMEGISYEVIVIDNASSDGTCRMIEQEFPDVILLQNSWNIGFARANNLGLSRARGEFILLMNPDTVWKKGNIKRGLQFLSDHPDVGGLGCRLILNEGCWQKSYGNFPTLSREMKEACYLSRFFTEWKCCQGMFIYKESTGTGPVDWVSCTFFLSSKEVLLGVGGLDERYFMYYEDIDLSKRVREKGRQIYYYPEIEILHHQRIPPIYDFGESPYVYFEKHYGSFSAHILRYVLLYKSALRIGIFGFLTLSGRKIYRDKLKTNYRTFKYHLFEGPDVLRKLGTPPSPEKTP